MRTELSRFMTGEPVCLIGKILKFGNMNFDGEATSLYIDPLTGLSVPMEFYPPDFTGNSIRIVDKDKTTKIMPLRINNTAIQNITHMWIPRHIPLEVGACFKMVGHIKSYLRANGSSDYCFIPLNLPVEISGP